MSGPPLGESCPLLTLCSLFIMSICNFSFFPFWFEGGIWVLIVSVPIYCLFVAFRNMKKVFLVRLFIISLEKFFFQVLSPTP